MISSLWFEDEFVMKDRILVEFVNKERFDDESSVHGIDMGESFLALWAANDDCYAKLCSAVWCMRRRMSCDGCYVLWLVWMDCSDMCSLSWSHRDSSGADCIRGRYRSQEQCEHPLHPWYAMIMIWNDEYAMHGWWICHEGSNIGWAVLSIDFDTKPSNG